MVVLEMRGELGDAILISFHFAPPICALFALNPAPPLPRAPPFPAPSQSPLPIRGDMLLGRMYSSA